jgi:hypothetical protein
MPVATFAFEAETDRSFLVFRPEHEIVVTSNARGRVRCAEPRPDVLNKPASSWPKDSYPACSGPPGSRRPHSSHEPDDSTVHAQRGAARCGRLLRTDVDDHVRDLVGGGKAPEQRRRA